MKNRYPQGKKSRGSQHWIQELVNQYPAVINEAIGMGAIRWVSPIQEDDYAEYRDQGFLDVLGIELPKIKLDTYWPHKGPQWDALGHTGTGEVVLVEAKAHILELFSPPTKAQGDSLDLIRRSLSQTEKAFRAKPGMDWSLRFYQYTNRLAHAYLLHVLNGIPARLVFMNVIGDDRMKGPRSKAEWESALVVLEEALGLTGKIPTYVTHAYVDVSGVVPKAIR